MRAGTRCAAALAAALLALGLAGCGAGQDAFTAETVPSVPGVNVKSEDGSILVRNARVRYDADGYPADADAPVELWLANETPGPIRIASVASDRAASVTVDEPVEIPPASVVHARLTASGLTGPVQLGGNDLPLTLSFDNGAEMTLSVPVGTPQDAPPRTPMTFDEGH